MNYGRIGALGGDVALVAARVSNAGEIDAANGDAGLLAGYKVVLTRRQSGRRALRCGARRSRDELGDQLRPDRRRRMRSCGLRRRQRLCAGGQYRRDHPRHRREAAGGGKVWLVAQGGTHRGGRRRIEAQGVQAGTAGAVETSGPDGEASTKVAVERPRRDAGCSTPTDLDHRQPTDGQYHWGNALDATAPASPNRPPPPGPAARAR